MFAAARMALTRPVSARTAVSRCTAAPMCAQRTTPTPVHHRLLSTNADGPVKKPKGPVSWAAVGLVAGLGGVSYYFYKQELDQRLERIREQDRKSIGTPSLGGPWSLVDQYGKPQTDADYRGNFTLMYFGFTHCPDICPDELDKISDAIAILDKEKGMGDRVTPIFITLDPRRDSVAVNREYIKDFHPRFLALTGTPGLLAECARAFRVYFSESEEDEDGDYLVDHSIISYLMGPDGKFLDYFAKNKTAEEIADQIRSRVKASQ